jgi:transcriptional regulator with XRE-family HTH domain
MPQRIVTEATPTRQSAELRAIREHVGCTQRCFAAYLGATPRSLSRWECGLRPVPRTVLYLARLYALRAVRPKQFFPAPAPSDPDRPTIELRPGSQCYWHSADCHGPWYAMDAQISRRRAVRTEVCEAHLRQAAEAIGVVSEHKRQPWRRPTRGV